MQVFVPYSSPLQVAKCLDAKRLHKQIIECKQILDAINGKGKGWFNHPVTKMYKPYQEWLMYYMYCLHNYHCGLYEYVRVWDNTAKDITPEFLTDEFCDQHKRRLYTKNPEHYKEFAHLGNSDENWYFVDGEIVKYVNGKML